MVWVNSCFRCSLAKKRNLLKESIDETDEGFKNRNLQDTQYLSKVLYNYINDTLEFKDYQSDKIKHVHCVNGAVTSYIRKRWGINKLREDGDLHHAVDSVVIACVTNGMINRISQFSKYKETEFFSKKADDVNEYDPNARFPFPWPNFRKELEIRTSNNPQRLLEDMDLDNYTYEQLQEIKPCFVSRMPTHKISGPAHKETIRSAKAINDGYVISKVSLSSLKLTKENEIENYYNPSSDIRLYNALKKRLIQYNGDAKKAFEQYTFEIPFRKPTKDGSLGPAVKKVKIIEKSSLSVPLSNGSAVAANDTMVRIDVFYIENEGYYYVPIYVADTVKAILPSRACVAHKPYNEWKEMNESDFIFSLYPNDLICISSKKDIKMNKVFKESKLQDEIFVNNQLFYYNSSDISTASIKIINHDNSYSVRGIGVKSLLSIKKFVVNPLGICQECKREKRMMFKRSC